MLIKAVHTAFLAIFIVLLLIRKQDGQPYRTYCSHVNDVFYFMFLSCHWLSKITKKSFAICHFMVKYADVCATMGESKGQRDLDQNIHQMCKSKLIYWNSGFEDRDETINWATYANHRKYKNKMYINSYIFGETEKERDVCSLKISRRWHHSAALTAFSSLQTSKKCFKKM